MSGFTRPGWARSGAVASCARGARAIAARRVLAAPPAVALLAAWAFACAPVDVVVEPVAADAAPMDAQVVSDAGDAGPDADTGPVPDTGAPDADVDAADDDGGAVDDACPYRREPPPGGTGELRDLVARGLARAICACTDYSGSAGLTVDRLDGTAGGDVGANGAFDIETSATLGGELIVAGVDDGLSLGPNVRLTVGGDLAVGGPLEGAQASVAVAGDARVRGRVDLVDLEVVGALTHTPGELLQVANEPRLGALIEDAVQVAPPCACEPAERLDVAELVRATAPVLPPLASATIPEQRCARYALDGGTVDTLVLGVSDDAALYVSGNVHVDAMTIDVAPGAEFDLFVEGALVVNGPVQIGSAAGGAVRVHVGGTGTLDLREGGSLHGALYAPGSELVLAGALDVRGALFVRRVAAMAAVVVHFDPSAGEP